MPTPPPVPPPPDATPQDGSAASEGEWGDIDLRRCFELAPDLLSVIDRSGRFVACNAAWCELLGVAADQLIGRGYREFIHPDDVERTVVAADALFATGGLESFCNRYRGSDGRWHTLEWRATEDGCCVHAAARDVTADVARERAEQLVAEGAALRVEIARCLASPGPFEARLEQIADRLGGLDDVVEASVFCEFEDRANGSGLVGCRALGAGEGTVGQCERSCTALDLQVEARCDCEAGSRVFGRHGHYHLPIRVEGRRIGAVCLVTSEDPTDHPARREVLRRVGEQIGEAVARERYARRWLVTAQRFALVTDGAGVGVWEVDLERHAVTWNAVMHRLYGTSGADHRPTVVSWLRAVCEDDRARLFGALRELARESASVEVSVRIRWPDGDVRWMVTRAILERDLRGVPKRLVGMQWDDTERARDQRRLREARLQAEAASRAKSDFLTNLSHEIRTPMTAIVGFTEVLASTDDLVFDPRERQRALHAVRGNARHLLQVIDDVLDVSRIEAGKLSIERQRFAAAEVIVEVCDLLRPDAEAKDLHLHVDLPPDLPGDVWSDPARLRQILINLVANGIKFTATGGIRIRAAMVDTPDSERQLEVAIEDTGIGMDAEQLAQIERFEAFSQVDASRSRRVGGNGLGLHLASRLANLLDGALRVRSEPGVGSVFTLTLAAGAAVAGVVSPVVAARKTEPDRLPSLAGARILLADDSVDNQRLIALFLRKSGAEVEVVANGAEALAALQPSPVGGRRPGLVLMDMQMPELDGYAATRRLRELGHSLPVLALTAHAMQGDRERCLESGCDDFLTKPVNRRQLIRACARWLERGR